MIEYVDEQVAQIHLDPDPQFGQRLSIEVVIVLEGDLARELVNLDQVGLGGITVTMRRAMDVNP